MKCIAAVVLLALAACVQGGLVGWNGLPIPIAYSAAVHAPVIAQYQTQQLVTVPASTRLIAPATYTVAHPDAITIDAAPAAVRIEAAPAAIAVAHAPAAVVVAPAEAQYTAATRGAVHTAPLPGHAISQTSLNVAPAPGTL